MFNEDKVMDSNSGSAIYNLMLFSNIVVLYLCATSI